MGRILKKIYLYYYLEGKTMQATDIIRDVVAVLSSPAWGGVGGIAALVSVPLSIFLARQPQPHARSSPALAAPKKSY